MSTPNTQETQPKTQLEKQTDNSPEKVLVQYATIDDALQQCFPKQASITHKTIPITSAIKKRVETQLGWEITEKKVILYTAHLNNQPTHYAIEVDELGKHYPITFLVAVTDTYDVHKIVVMIYRERYGMQVRKKRFLRQFWNKTKNDPLQVDNDITGISGATISAWAIASGVKKALLLTEEIINDTKTTSN